MEDVQRARAEQERAAVSPARQLGKEVGGRGELNVEVQPILHLRQETQDVLVGLDPHVDIDGRRAPPLDDRCRAADEVDACWLRGCSPSACNSARTESASA